jgi:hypothetical protein
MIVDHRAVQRAAVLDAHQIAGQPTVAPHLNTHPTLATVDPKTWLQRPQKNFLISSPKTGRRYPPASRTDVLLLDYRFLAQNQVSSAAWRINQGGIAAHKLDRNRLQANISPATNELNHDYLKPTLYAQRSRPTSLEVLRAPFHRHRRNERTRQVGSFAPASAFTRSRSIEAAPGPAIASQRKAAK